jgi:predicted transcriptional regulator
MADQQQSMLGGVLNALRRSRGAWVRISVATGVPYHTLTKIAQGKTERPRVDTVQRLHDYLCAKDPSGAAQEGCSAGQAPPGG